MGSIVDPIDAGAMTPTDIPTSPDPALDDPALTDPTPMPPPPVAPARRLRRANGSTLGGVASGIARYYGLDVTLVRVLFLVAVVFGGFGFFAYLAGWALIPPDHHPDPRPVVLNGGLGALIVGALAGMAAVSVAFGAGGGWALGPAILIGVGLYLLSQREGDGIPLTRTRAVPPPPATWGQVYTAPTNVAAPERGEPGPPVTAVTLALVAVVTGALATLASFTDVEVGATALFGAATAVIGAGLVASAFLGRARGLYLAGFVALGGLALAPIIDHLPDGGMGERRYVIEEAADLRSSYQLGAGELVLDLRNADLDDDIVVDIEVGAGLVTLYLPENLNVDLDATSTFGVVTVPDPSSPGAVIEVEGVDSNQVMHFDGGETAATVTLDIDVTFGAVEVWRG